MERKRMPASLFRIHRGSSNQNASRRPGICSRLRLRQAIKGIREETKEYCHETGLHGFKYITSPESRSSEKFIWFLICASGIVICIFLMLLVWQRFQETPTVTTIESTNHPIWELEFPAVTICNFNKIYLPRVDRIEKEFRKMGLSDKQIRDFFQSLPKLIRPEYITVDVKPAMKALTALGYTIDGLMQQLMQPCDEMLVRCAWLGNVYNCSKMFHMTKSVDGYCCSFNYHALLSDFEVHSEHDEKQHLPKTTTRNTVRNQFDEAIPGVGKTQMVAGSGRDVGLTVVCDFEGHLYGGATRPYIGASVIIHDPDDYPEISILSALSEPGTEVDVIITGTIIQSSNNVRSLDTDKRHCWFGNEVKLGSTDEYSYQTCVTECRIEHVKTLCDCIPFYYPNLYPKVRICDLTDINCLRAYRRILSSLQTPTDVAVANETVDDVECDCLPQCNDRWYSLITQIAGVDQIQYDSPMFDSEYYSFGLDIRNLSLIHVYFRDITCLKYRKDVLLTWDGLFASFGGIFGLCLGGSVISLIEIFYYYFVRIFHKKKIQRSAINTGDSMNFQSQKKNIKKLEETMNDKLNNLDILKHNLYFHPNNFTGNELGTLSTNFKHFKVASRLEHNRLV